MAPMYVGTIKTKENYEQVRLATLNSSPNARVPRERSKSLLSKAWADFQTLDRIRSTPSFAKKPLLPDCTGI